MSSVNVEGQPQHSWFQVPHQTLPRDPPMHVQEHNQPGTLGGPPDEGAVASSLVTGVESVESSGTDLSSIWSTHRCSGGGRCT